MTPHRAAVDAARQNPHQQNRKRPLFVPVWNPEVSGDFWATQSFGLVGIHALSTSRSTASIEQRKLSERTSFQGWYLRFCSFKFVWRPPCAAAGGWNVRFLQKMRRAILLYWYLIAYPVFHFIDISSPAVNAADNKQRDKNMNTIKITLDAWVHTLFLVNEYQSILESQHPPGFPYHEVAAQIHSTALRLVSQK